MALTNGLQIPYGVQPTIAVPVDSYSGPYSGADSATAIAAANAAIPAASRFQSMEVRLIIAGTPYKYWYKDGTADGNLVEFVSSSISVSNATDNRVLTSTGTSLGINAESNLTFDGTDLTVTGDINVNGATSADVKTTTSTATVFNQPTTLSLGAAATSLTIGGVTTAATTNISNGAIATGTKTINIGTGGTAGSTTTIAIGTSSGGAGTTTVNGNLSVTGNTTIGDSSADTLTINAGTVSLSSNLNIGGNALYVNPSSNYVGINNNSPAYELDVSGTVKATDILLSTNTVKAAVGAPGYIFNDTVTGVYIGSTASTNKIGGANTNDTSFYFGTNPTGTGKTKDVELGTGGLSGSTTNILIGSASGGTSTTTIQGNFETTGNTTIGDALADALTIKAGTVSLPNGNLNFDSGTLYIDATNNRVGIANSSPSTALDVTGNLTLSGDIAVNGGDITTTASTLNVGNTTAAFTANLATGVTISGATKTVNIGTDSATGSTTNVNLGSALGTSTTTVNGNISVTGDTTLGDAAGDAITFNASTAAIPNNFNFGSNSLYINSTNKSIGVGNNSAKATLDVYGDGLFRTTANSTNGVIRPNPLGDTLGARIDFGTYGTGDGTNFGDYGNVGAYGSKFNINAKSRDISFKIDDVERMNLSSTSPYSLTLTDGSILMTSTSARAITHTGASGQNLTISSTNGNVLIEGSTFNGNDVTVPGFITFGGTTALKDSGNATAVSLPGSGNVTVAGILRVNGDAIRDSGGNSAISFDVTAGATTLINFNSDIKINLSSGTSADITSNVVDASVFSGASNTGTVSLGSNATTVSIGSATTNVSVPGYITFGASTALKDSGNATAVSLPGSGNVTVAGILRVNGNAIRDSGGVSAVTFAGSGSVGIGKDLSISSGSVVAGLSAATAGGNSAANAVAIPYLSNMVAVLQPAVSAFHYKLPTAVGNSGRILIIKNITQNTYSANVYTSVNGQTVDYLGTWNGAASPVASFVLANTSASGSLNAVTLYSDGSNWFIISSHRNV